MMTPPTDLNEFLRRRRRRLPAEVAVALDALSVALEDRLARHMAELKAAISEYIDQHAVSFTEADFDNWDPDMENWVNNAIGECFLQIEDLVEKHLGADGFGILEAYGLEGLSGPDDINPTYDLAAEIVLALAKKCDRR
jgi:hypothetical protein